MVFTQGTGIAGAGVCQPEIRADRIQRLTREEPLRFDLLVEGCLLVEAKAADKILPIHKAQLLSCMKLLNVPVGVPINFHGRKVTGGISGLILSGANR